MSDQIKHECGIGMIRLFKPLDYYYQKYGSALWGLNKMYLLMEKQRNRGQDGAGLATVKLNMRPGKPYMARIRNNRSSPWTNLFQEVDEVHSKVISKQPEKQHDPGFLKQNFPYAGEVLMGHLRYGTHGNYDIEACHPVTRQSNWKNRTLALAGNFNLTNVDYLFKKLVELGQHPRYVTDTVTVLERIGHFLDVENSQLNDKLKETGYSPNEVADLVAEELDVLRIFKNSAKAWDGGYVMGGIIGNGDAFIARDPIGIRPCYHYANDEFMVAASERATISTVFNLNPDQITELPPGHVLHVKGSQHDSEVRIEPFAKPQKRRSCSFERIYFSRGSDINIYRERKELGKAVVPKVLKAVDNDLDNTVFSYIPNTAESSFWGMIKELESYLNERKIKQILSLGTNPKEEDLRKILNTRPRVEKSVNKDMKLRTFIADDSSRNDLVSHVYDITQGIIRQGKDNLVCIDDSIVRGTTLKKSILHMLARLKPKKIVVVSSAPQIRYPDCYGIDMSQIDKLVAFQAAIALLKERGMEDVIEQVYKKILDMRDDAAMHSENVVKQIYAPFTAEEISQKITEILIPDDFQPELEIVYQSLEDLHKSMPRHIGDWYFSGNYPTPGGNRVVNQAYLNFFEGKNERAYQGVIA
ncbi:MAG: amidophosphoribosyltransferase [Bacteroidota bacterium]